VIFSSLPIVGASVLDVEEHRDQRGFFARVWCRQELAAHGFADHIEQASVAFSRLKGTLRGLHFQKPPHEEEKFVRCTRGAACVVAVDLRPQSPTYLSAASVELTADNHRTLYVPKGCAQGYQTLTDDTELLYQITTPYVPESASGVRYDDPAFGIQWPIEVAAISQRDRSWPDYVASTC
jgi:dTDP-4-dehydrorhamnose 3,5-epimerase